MAAVDKLYGNREEYDELKYWCKKHNPDLLGSFYEWDETDTRGAMTNFSIEEDIYLLKNYPDKNIKDKIKDCYDCKDISDEEVVSILIGESL